MDTRKKIAGLLLMAAIVLSGCSWHAGYDGYGAGVGYYNYPDSYYYGAPYGYYYGGPYGHFEGGHHGGGEHHEGRGR
jgi:hypothetical protein